MSLTGHKYKIFWSQVNVLYCPIPIFRIDLIMVLTFSQGILHDTLREYFTLISLSIVQMKQQFLYYDIISQCNLDFSIIG